MNKEKIKELFAINYIRLLTEYSGYYVTIPGQDYGTDLHIEEMLHLTNGSYIPSGKIISLQVKCTTEESIIQTPIFIKYDLAIRNYNLLIQRQYYQHNIHLYSPYILVVVVLPKNKKDWLLESAKEALHIRAKAYWFIPPVQAVLSTNKSSKRISIPTDNLVNLNIFPHLFKVLWDKNHDL